MTRTLCFMLTLDSAQKYVSSLWILLTQEVRLNTLDDFPGMSGCPSRRLWVRGWFIWKSSSLYFPLFKKAVTLQEFTVFICCAFCYLSLWVLSICQPWSHPLGHTEINEQLECIISETNLQRSTSRVVSKLLLSINKTACSNEPSWKGVTNDVKVN